MKLTEKVFALVEPTVKELGYELYEVDYQKEYDNWVLTLYIDHPNGVSLDDCERVSNAVDPVLDAADPIEQAYFLSVSSIGLDRPLKNDKDFIRNIGKLLDVRLYAPLEAGSAEGGKKGGSAAKNAKKELCGKLLEFDENRFTLETADGRVTVGRKQAALIRPHMDF